MTLHVGDCLDVLRTLPVGTFDAVICDPPYPCIKRSYGYWTEAEWFDLMNPVVAECRRVLKPTGSAVFILQPNSERAGKLRPWLFEFQAKWCREWGVVQDAYWWNYTAVPVGAANTSGLLRGSVKPCVWLGPADCWRDQEAVLWDESEGNKAMRSVRRGERRSKGDGRVDRVDNRRMGETATRRGGVTPFNLIPVGGGDRWNGAGVKGHCAGTPLALCRWWVRYICPPGGTVLDCFAGSGTTGLACEAEGRRCVLIERDEGYAEIIRRRLGPPAGTDPTPEDPCDP